MGGKKEFRTVLIANRGEIAVRIIRTLKRMGIRAVAVYSEADRNAAHVLAADEAVLIGPPPAAESYLDIDAILGAAARTSAEAIHPGYGFLSENAGFAERCAKGGIKFIGPRPAHIRAFGLKHEARALAEICAVPLVPGTALLNDLTEAETEAERLGFPLMLKSTAGGGGIGLRLCRDLAELRAAFDAVVRLGQGNFGHSGVFLERYIERARHIEVQIFGDGKGQVLVLGERDCSVQRRNQKVIEETPAPGLPQHVRAAMNEAATRLARHVAYESAGTVEFVYDGALESFFFLEVNTRLQVEHGVTEAVLGVDLVEWMIRQAAGTLPPLSSLSIEPHGAAIEARLYAENPAKDFRPSSGRLSHVVLADDVRVDSWIAAGDEVSHFYDPLLAKLIAHGKTREEARTHLADALERTKLYGIETNLPLLRAILDAREFKDGRVHTKFLDTFAFPNPAIEVIAPGALSMVQDYPGRLGHWEVGVPPSGPFDSLSFRLINRVVGNEEGAPALEFTIEGPELLFLSDAVVALGGAPVNALLNGTPVEPWTPIAVKKGQVLAIGQVKDAGVRGYLAVRHGFDVPDYLGSAAAFTLGQFGGHAGGALKPGDVLRLREDGATENPRALPSALVPALSHDWEIGVLYGPHGAPDFFTPEDIETLFSATYEVHFNSARTGVRLIGPHPVWARHDGGEAGLHPSNIHDNAYAVGAIDFTGDMPIILGPDGPSLGGFVCPATVALAELWKVGQLKPGDRVRFVSIETAEAERALRAQNDLVRTLEKPSSPMVLRRSDPGEAILATLDDALGPIVVRRSGEDNLLIEFGPPQLDLKLRCRAQQLREGIEAEGLSGIIDLTPGIRSLQIHFEPTRLAAQTLFDAIGQVARDLAPVESFSIPNRVVHLPLSWNDPQIQLAVRKYHELVRPDAPWCPSNIEFIRRINGLEDEAAVRDIILDARYLVLGLGDVYLGAPVATPLDPRKRLVTTKYNPARVWTPENAVGIGGAYLCVYGMEGPGGYQLFGRTVQMWSSYRQSGSFEPGTPWLLRHFDEIRFFLVSPDELLEAREGFKHGRYEVEIEPGRFSLAENEAFLAANADSVAAFRARQRAAFAEERENWRRAGLAEYIDEGSIASACDDDVLPDGTEAVRSPVAGNVWVIKAEPGAIVKKGDVLVILESMKMEIELKAGVSGRLVQMRCQKGRSINVGEVVAVIEVAP